MTEESASTEEEKPTPESISSEVLFMLFLLVIAVSIGNYMRRKGSRYLQEAAVSTLIGIIAAGALKYSGNTSHLATMQSGFVDIFMVVLLPPIIFESGYNLSKRPFFVNFGSILLYAFLGTFIAAIITSSSLYFLGQLGYTYAMSLTECCAYGSLISATDPVSVLAIFKEMGADRTLYALIFGESVFNDAVTIVMYQTIKAAMSLTDVTPTEVSFLSIASFIMIFLGSFLIGIICALLVTFMLKRQYKIVRGFQNIEIVIMVATPYVAYLIAQGLDLSGIVSILFNGIILSQYASQNLSNESRKVLKIAYETMAYACETCVFIFLGMGVFAFNHPYSKMGFSLFFWNLLVVHIARAGNILVVTWLANKRRFKTPVTKIFMFVMWVSGLRGAIAYALSLLSNEDFADGNGDLILLLTLLYSLFTIYIVASFLNPVLDKCDVKDKGPLALESAVDIKEKGCCERLKVSVALFDLHQMTSTFIREERVPKKKILYPMKSGSENKPLLTHKDSENPNDEKELHDISSRKPLDDEKIE